MSEKLGYEIYCKKCKSSMGEVTANEYAAWLTDAYDLGLCFACEPYGCSMSPEFFWQFNNGDQIVIGSDLLYCEDNLIKLGKLAQSHTHERERERILSSYTKLNRTEKNRAILSNGREIKLCPSCDGKGMLFEFGETFACASCDGIGALESAFFIPAWIIGLGAEND